MDNARLAKLELALERERHMMKRQELLRQMWRVYRDAERDDEVSGGTRTPREWETPETRTTSLSPALNELDPQSAPTVV